MGYSQLHLVRNNQHTHMLVDDVTTLPSLFVTLYQLNELSGNSLGTQRNAITSLRYFYVYYLKKHKVTFDYDFIQEGFNTLRFLDEFQGFFDYLLGEQHKSDYDDIADITFINENSVKKPSYREHLAVYGRFLKFLNERYMTPSYQEMLPSEVNALSERIERKRTKEVKRFNKKAKVTSSNPHAYVSITDMQYIQLNNMLLPSTPEFVDVETGEIIEAKLNPCNPFNPFKEGFLQFRNFSNHRLMYSYGLRVGETQLLTVHSFGVSQPDAHGNVKYLLKVQNLPDDVDDPRKHPPSIKTATSYRTIELDVDDYHYLKIYVEQYRNPLFSANAEKAKQENKAPIKDHSVLFIKGNGKLSPLSYDAIRHSYNKIDKAFIKLHPYYRVSRQIDYMVKLTAHVGRHTWAYMALHHIYFEHYKLELDLSKNYGLRSRMEGLLDAAAAQLRTLGGWRVDSKMPYRYAKRFVELVANGSNLARLENLKSTVEVPVQAPKQSQSESNNNDANNSWYGDDSFDEFI